MPEKKAPLKAALLLLYFGFGNNFTDQYGYRTNVFQPAGQRDFLWQLFTDGRRW